MKTNSKTNTKHEELYNPITKGTDAVERCVICGEKTIYTVETQIDQRSCYVEGGGQLCRKCYMDTYCKTNYQGDT